MGKQFKKSLPTHYRQAPTQSNLKLKNPTTSSLNRRQRKQNKKSNKKELKFQSTSKISGNDKEKVLLKKIKLKPLKSLFIETKENINNMTINNLKEFAHNFDINPDINFRLLSYLEKNSPKEYKKYINKYKFTLKFQDALKLKCFDENEISQVMDEFNKNISHFKLGISKIKSKESIISFSKIKLFNLLLLLQSKDVMQYKYKEIIEKIKSYCIPQTMIFKIPNKFANIELLYYYYIIIIVGLFIPDNSENKNLSSAQDFTSSFKKGVFFNFNKGSKPEKMEIDLNNFFKRKKSLEDYIKGIDIEKQDIGNKPKKMNQKEEEEKEEENFSYKINIFQVFGENIKEIIKLEDENQIIQRIKFLIYLILFLRKNQSNLEKLSNCLKGNDASKIGKHPNLVYLDEKAKQKFEKNNYREIALSNINSTFKSNYINPFNYKAYFYTFPYLLQKNIIQNDEELFNSFIDFLKYIYTSPIMEDIFYLSKEFQEFIYPFDDKDILEELLENTIFLPFPNDSLFGYTQKEFPEVLISANLKEEKPYSSDFSQIICEISQILNTCIHEDIKHYIKALIFYNSFQLGISKRINSDLDEIDEEMKLINAILIKNKYTNYNLLSLDGGDKAEVFLYGNKLNSINFSQSLELFKMSNWKKTIPEHIENFNNHKKIVKDNDFISLDSILKDNDLCEFYKLFCKKFVENVHKKGDDIISYDNNAFASRNPSKLNEEKKGELFYNYACSISFHPREKDTTC